MAKTENIFGESGGGGSAAAIAVDMTFTPTDLNGKALVLNSNKEAGIQIVTSGSGHRIGNVDVSQFSSMTIKRVSGGQGIGVYQATSLSDTSLSTALGITWGDFVDHVIDLTGVDYILLWGDGSSSSGTNTAIFKM